MSGEALKYLLLVILVKQQKKFYTFGPSFTGRRTEADVEVRQLPVEELADQVAARDQGLRRKCRLQKEAKHLLRQAPGKRVTTA